MKEETPGSMECYFHLRNVQDLLSDGKTSHERRFGIPFNGPVIPFGAMVEYHPISAKDTSRLHQFGPKVLPGTFLGYVLYAGRIWKVHARRLNAKEVAARRKNRAARKGEWSPRGTGMTVLTYPGIRQGW